MLDNNAWWDSYLLKPVGIRKQDNLRLWCIQCYSEDIFFAKTKLYTFCRCKKCSFEWDFGPCWSCRQEYVDSRDPANSLCYCGWYRCVLCKACNLMGCKLTNPYSKKHKRSSRIYIDDMIESDQDYDRCELCGCFGADLPSGDGVICGGCAENLLTHDEI